METSRAFELGKQARAFGGGLDSSRLRGSATNEAKDKGVVPVAKYNQQVSILASVELFDGLLAGVEQSVALRRDLPLVVSLLSTALKLGVPAERAVAVAFSTTDGGVDIAGLAALVDDASDDLEAAALARTRLQAPGHSDTSLEDFAAELGLDLDDLRAEIDAGTPSATFG